MEHLLQGDPQFVDDGRVLLPPLLPPEAHVAVTGEAVQVEAGEGAEGVVSVHLHVLVVSPVRFTSEEHLEGVGASEESGEGGVRVSMEGVGESGALSVTSGPTSSLETFWATEMINDMSAQLSESTYSMTDKLWLQSTAQFIRVLLNDLRAKTSNHDGPSFFISHFTSFLSEYCGF